MILRFLNIRRRRRRRQSSIWHTMRADYNFYINIMLLIDVKYKRKILLRYYVTVLTQYIIVLTMHGARHHYTIRVNYNIIICYHTSSQILKQIYDIICYHTCHNCHVYWYHWDHISSQKYLVNRKNGLRPYMQRWLVALWWWDHICSGWFVRYNIDITYGHDAFICKNYNLRA